MQEENGLNPAERELEAALQRVTPAAVSMKRDALIFQAGAQSARRQVRFWQGTAGGLAATAALALFGLVDRLPRPAIKPVVVYQEAGMKVAPVAMRQIEDPYSVIALRRAVLEGGIDALPSVSIPLPDRRRQDTPSLRPSSLLKNMTGGPS